MIERISNILNKDMKLGIRFLVLALSGVLTGLTIAFPGLGFLEWLTIIPAAVILLKRGSDKNVKLRWMYLDGLVFFYGFYLVCYHFFLSMYPLDFIEGVSDGAAAVVVAVAWFGLSLLQALMGGLVFLLASLIFRGAVCQRIGFFKPFVASALWAVFEWSQNFGWWGVPWGKLAIGQTKYLAGIQNASWFGSYFITFVIVAVNLLLAYGLLNIEKIKILRISAIVAVSILSFQYISGAAIWFTTDINEGEKVKIACVQGNISASNMWTKETVKKLERVYTEQTYAAANAGAKIVLWPETAIPFDLDHSCYTDTNKTYDDMCRDLSNDAEVYLLVGAYFNDGENSYNSLICYTPDGERFDTVYNKRRLVPFGEFVPLRGLFEKVIPPLTEILITFDDIIPGDSPSIMNIDGTNVGNLICFDSIYDGLTLDSVRDGAEVICLSTNDSWFMGSAALRIHNSHAQLRATESGRYITRCASTGISTIVSPRGEVLSHIDADTEGMMIYEVCERDNKTAWYYLGNTFVYICMVFLFAVFTVNIVLKIKKKSKKDLTL